MNAWVVKEWRGPDGKLCRQKMAEGVQGVKPGDCFVVEWFGGKHRRRKKFKTEAPDDAKGTKARAAKRAADSYAKELTVASARGELDTSGRVRWELFRQRYESEHLKSLAKATAVKVKGIFDSVEKILGPKRVADVTADKLSVYAKELRDKSVKRWAEIT